MIFFVYFPQQHAFYLNLAISVVISLAVQNVLNFGFHFILHFVYAYGYGILLSCGLCFVYWLLTNIENRNQNINVFTNNTRIEALQTPDMCAICLDEMNVCVRIKECKHIFHYKCLKTWCCEYNHQMCPMCKYDFDPLL